MPKTKISEFSSDPANNTDIDGINIAEGCAPSGINNAIRELMAQLKDWQSGTSLDTFNTNYMVATAVDINGGAIDGAVIGGSSAAAGTFTDVTLNAQGDLRFADSDSSNWVAFQAPATVASNVTWTLPNADGTANQVLATNGSGTLAWATGASGSSISAGNSNVTVTDSGTGKIEFNVDAVEVADFTTGAVVFNETGADQDFRVEGDTNANLLVVDAGADKVGIGTNTFNTNGGVLQVSNGIAFPATQSASTDANTLDDYEEGTWTPSVNNMTTTGSPAYGGTYRKIGSQVTIWFYSTTAGGVATYTATANSTNVSGLPFASSFGGVGASGGEPGVYTNGNTTAGGFLQGPGGGTTFYFSSSMASSQGLTASITYVTT